MSPVHPCSFLPSWGGDEDKVRNENNVIKRRERGVEHERTETLAATAAVDRWLLGSTFRESPRSRAVDSTGICGLRRPGTLTPLSFLRVFVAQDGLDHQCPNREFLEGDEVPGQDRIQLVDAVRRGPKSFQLAPAFFLRLHGCRQFYVVVSLKFNSSSFPSGFYPRFS